MTGPFAAELFWKICRPSTLLLLCPLPQPSASLKPHRFGATSQSLAGDETVVFPSSLLLISFLFTPVLCFCKTYFLFKRSLQSTAPLHPGTDRH